MPKAIDVTGERYGRLVALEKLPYNQGRQVLWRWKCDCGNVVAHALAAVRHGGTVSCGCYRDEILIARVETHGHRKGRQTSRTLNQYNIAKQKCFNPRYKSYANFGGRGITMCPGWASGFPAFLADMGECPEGQMLRRLDEDRDFEPGNCVWG